MKGIKINWGVFANIEEDLNEQGYSLGEKRKIWEKTKEARSLLTIKGFLTEAERMLKRNPGNLVFQQRKQEVEKFLDSQWCKDLLQDKELT